MNKLLNQPTEATIQNVTELQKQSIVLEDSDRESSSNQNEKDFKELMREGSAIKTNNEH